VTCPSCGAGLLDVRGHGLNVIQAAREGLCILFGDDDYQCAKKQRERDSHTPSPGLLSHAVTAMAQKDGDERVGYDREGGRYKDEPATPRQLRDSANRPWEE
jgi:hypothetical protein